MVSILWDILWDWGVLAAGTLLAAQLFILLLPRKAQLAASYPLPVHLHPFPILSLGVVFQKRIRCWSNLSGFVLPITARLGLGFGDEDAGFLQHPWQGVPEGSPRCWWVPPTPGLGSPSPSFQSFPCQGISPTGWQH